jgi:hypothetical protein
LKAADNQHRHAHRYQNGEHRCIRPEPCDDAVHINIADTQHSTVLRHLHPFQFSTCCGIQYYPIEHTTDWVQQYSARIRQILQQKILANKRIKGEDSLSSGTYWAKLEQIDPQPQPEPPERAAYPANSDLVLK